MDRELRRLAAFLTVATLISGAPVALAAGTCTGFKWDVRHEQALFATRPEDRKAGGAAASAPVIALDRLYRFQLTPQGNVTFAVPPGKMRHMDGAYAGLVRLHIAAAGLYRIALSQPFWVDVLEKGTLIASSDFTGARGCSAPHKVVLYQLAAGDQLLQVSGWAAPQAELTVTRVPAGASVPHR
ncbi:MAG TPA: hypothetical protein VGG63_11595 [Steroidobacteraceae bacterium]|jgi:hypothetical protein